MSSRAGVGSGDVGGLMVLDVLGAMVTEVQWLGWKVEVYVLVLTMVMVAMHHMDEWAGQRKLQRTVRTGNNSSLSKLTDMTTRVKTNCTTRIGHDV